MSVETKDRIETRSLLRQAGVSSVEFHDWIKFGLLPRWQAREIYGGQGSRYWYPAEVLELAKRIKAWRDEGKLVREIRALLKAEGAEV